MYHTLGLESVDTPSVLNFLLHFQAQVYIKNRSFIFNDIQFQLHTIGFGYIFALLRRLVKYGLCLALKATNNTSK